MSDRIGEFFMWACAVVLWLIVLGLDSCADEPVKSFALLCALTTLVSVCWDYRGNCNPRQGLICAAIALCLPLAGYGISKQSYSTGAPLVIVALAAAVAIPAAVESLSAAIEDRLQLKHVGALGAGTVMFCAVTAFFTGLAQLPCMELAAEAPLKAGAGFTVLYFVLAWLFKISPPYLLPQASGGRKRVPSCAVTGASSADIR